MSIKKVCVILSLLFLASSQILATNFTGVKFINEAGKPMEGKIENWTGKEWNFVASGPNNYADLHSGKGSRYILWRDPNEPNTIYQTQKAYSSPDTITVKDGGKTYDMSSGIGGLDKDKNKKATVIIHKGKKPLPEEPGKKPSPKEPAKKEPGLIGKLKKGVEKVANLANNVLNYFVTLTDELADEFASAKTPREQRDLLKKYKVELVKEIMTANRKIDALEQQLEKSKEKDADTIRELANLRNKLKEKHVEEKNADQRIATLEKNHPEIKKGVGTIQQLKDKVADLNQKISNIEKVNKQPGKEHYHVFWLNIYKTLKSETQQQIEALQKAKK